MNNTPSLADIRNQALISPTPEQSSIDEQPKSLADIRQSAAVEYRNEEIGLDKSTAPVDRKAFLAQEMRRILDESPSEFGTAFDNPDEPRGASTEGFWERMVPRGWAKNTRADVENVMNYGLEVTGIEKPVGEEGSNLKTSVDHLLNKVYEMQQKYPDLMDSEDGKAFIKEIDYRIKTASEQDELGFVELGGLMLDYASNDPAGFADLILDEMVYNPVIPLLSYGAYRVGAAAAQAAANGVRLTEVINKLRMGTPRQRLAAVALSSSANMAGYGTAEAGINVALQTSANQSAGRETGHNTITAAQLGLAAGVTVGMLRGAWGVINGQAGRMKSANKAAQVQGYRDMNHLIDDLAIKSGWQPADIIQHWKNNFDELPGLKIVDEVMQNKRVDDIAATTTVSTPRSPRYVKPEQVEESFAKVNAEYNQQTGGWLGQLFEKKGDTAPYGRDTTTGNWFYNIKAASQDLDNGATWLRGLNKDGTRRTGSGSQLRQKIFEGIDDTKLNSWLRKRGARGYIELLQRIEANKERLRARNLPEEASTRAAIDAAFEEMGAARTMFNRTTIGDKLRNGVRATYTQAAKTGTEVAKNPALLYTPIRDVFMDTKRFIDDVVKGPVEGYEVAARQRDILTRLLRDWEGNRLTGEMDVKLFTDWIKREVPDAQQRYGLSHFMEGEEALSRYNAYRIKHGQKEIRLSEQEKKVAAVGRKYLDDILDWSQRSELFSLFRKNPSMYKRAKQRAGDTSVDKRSRIPDEELWRFISGSTDPRGMKWDVSGKKNAHGYYQNYMPRLIKKEFAPTEKSLYEWSLDDAHRAGQLQTKANALKKRSYETMMDAIDAGEELYTMDFADLLQVYGKSMLRSQVNARLVDRLGKMKNVNGYPMIGRKSEVPDYYVEFKHPNFRGPNDENLYVNPNMAPDLRLYFDTNNPGVANRVLQNIVLIAKRAALGLSFFHIAALGWSGLVSGQNVGDVIKNVIPSGGRLTSRGLRALSGATGPSGRDADYLMIGMRNGLGLGVLEELKGDTLINGMRKLAGWTEDIIGNNKYFGPLGRPLGFAVGKTIRGVARGQELIDSHLWDHVNSGLKATTFLTTMEKMVLQDAKRVNSGAQAELTSLDKIAQRAAQFTNDAYGNQNWAQMAMNVENFMGHRIAAALNKPSMRGYIRLLVFAPDWSLSNLRVLGKTVSGLVPYGKPELAHREYAKYALRSAVLFAMVNEILQVTNGQPSIFEESGNDLLYADLGDGKKMQISKQLAEVISAIINGPLHVAEHKLSAPVKAIRDADSVGEFAGNMFESAIPIGVKQGVTSGNVWGSLGMPYYEN